MNNFLTLCVNFKKLEHPYLEVSSNVTWHVNCFSSIKYKTQLINLRIGGEFVLTTSIFPEIALTWFWYHSISLVELDPMDLLPVYFRSICFSFPVYRKTGSENFLSTEPKKIFFPELPENIYMYVLFKSLKYCKSALKFWNNVDFSRYLTKISLSEIEKFARQKWNFFSPYWRTTIP